MGILYCVTLAVLVASNQCDADDLIYTSETYGYSIKLPIGWIRIPNSEVARMKQERLPLEAQHIIYDAAFQEAREDGWFNWPYVLIQVVPSSKTKLEKQPSEAEFFRLVRQVTAGRTIEKLNEVASAAPRPVDRRIGRSAIASLANTVAQVEVPKRKFTYVIEISDPEYGAVKAYMGGVFLSNGNLVQICAFTRESDFPVDSTHFQFIHDSVSNRNQ